MFGECAHEPHLEIDDAICIARKRGEQVALVLVEKRVAGRATGRLLRFKRESSKVLDFD